VAGHLGLLLALQVSSSRCHLTLCHDDSLRQIPWVFPNSRISAVAVVGGSNHRSICVGVCANNGEGVRVLVAAAECPLRTPLRQTNGRVIPQLRRMRLPRLTDMQVPPEVHRPIMDGIEPVSHSIMLNSLVHNSFNHQDVASIQDVGTGGQQLTIMQAATSTSNGGSPTYDSPIHPALGGDTQHIKCCCTGASQDVWSYLALP
jgi:hypothetical protein